MLFNGILKLNLFNYYHIHIIFAILSNVIELISKLFITYNDKIVKFTNKVQ
jgi:hypothetical protein